MLQNLKSSQFARLKEVALAFLNLGATGFGGPTVLLAEMQERLVRKKNWMDGAEFTRALPLLKAMPGPVAFQTAVFLANRRAGFLGALVGAVSFVLPAFFLMIGFSYFSRFIHENLFLTYFLRGMQIATLGVAAGSLCGLVGVELKSLLFWVLAGVSLAATLMIPGIEPLLVILMGGVEIFSVGSFKTRELGSLTALGAVCLKAGAIVFGTGLAVIPVLRHDFVEVYGWLNDDVFLQGLTYGQLTPGPVVIAVTYFGHTVFGWKGAVVATAAVFLPGFIHMTTWFPRAVKWAGDRKWVAAFTKGALAAVFATVLVALFHVGRELEPSRFELNLIGVAFLITILKRAPAWVVILGGGGLMLLWFANHIN